MERHSPREHHSMNLFRGRGLKRESPRQALQPQNPLSSQPRWVPTEITYSGSHLITSFEQPVLFAPVFLPSEMHGFKAWKGIDVTG